MKFNFVFYRFISILLTIFIMLVQACRLRGVNDARVRFTLRSYRSDTGRTRPYGVETFR